MYSDLHIGADRVDINKIKETLRWINNIAKEKGVSCIFNLGDTFDFYNHTKSKMRITPSLIADLNTFAYEFKDHFVLRGNHEFHEEGDLITVLDLYRAHPIINPTEAVIDNKTLLLMPYYEDIYVDKIDYEFKDKYDYVFGHYDISGASFESGYRDTGKDSSILNKFSFDYMYIGHYHIRQKIRSNIESIGSCQSRVKSDNASLMGITILDVKTGETEFIENPYAEYNINEELKTVGTKYQASKKYNILEEVDNFKLEKTGIDAILDYVNSKRGNYDEVITDYVIYYLEELKKS
jgi:DNA repair exonuclease SbcCD nuclease subunit